MLVLVLNTCGNNGSVALAEDRLVLAEEPLPGRGTSEVLLPAIRKLFAATARLPRELKAVGVVDGPGSFTGVRVGMSAAKGLCDAAGCGLIAMSRLALLADAAATEQPVLALLDAGRGEFYAGLYRRGVCLQEALLTAAETDALMSGATAVTSEPRVAEARAIRLLPESGPAALLHMLHARIAAGQWSDTALADANYLRRTDAELKQAGL